MLRFYKRLQIQWFEVSIIGLNLFQLFDNAGSFFYGSFMVGQ